MYKKGDVFQMCTSDLIGLKFCIVDVVDNGYGPDLHCVVVGDGRSPTWQKDVVYPFWVPHMCTQQIMSHSVLLPRFNHVFSA